MQNIPTILITLRIRVHTWSSVVLAKKVESSRLSARRANPSLGSKVMTSSRNFGVCDCASPMLISEENRLETGDRQVSYVYCNTKTERNASIVNRSIS